jgi:two-component system cell cycle sensor histidine kinase/response regulator CckA
VLLVDDEDVVRNIGEIFLDKAGYSVTTAADGQCALDFFREHSAEIACVVLDLSMPDMDGGQVFEMMRDVRPDVPILISSGYSGNDIMKRFEQCEHWGFLQKPFSSDALISEVSRMTGKVQNPQ